MTEAAVEASTLPARISSLGFPGKTLSGAVARNARGHKESLRDLIRRGAREEDDDFRSLQHFYDPVANSGLALPSPLWALEPNGPVSTGQIFSYADARTHLFEAVTKPTKAERDRAYGLLFETIGHVVHHVQDMAQPQHVRDDLHCSEWYCPGPIHEPSRYEEFVNELTLDDELAYDGYAKVNSDSDPDWLTEPVHFWHTQLRMPELGRGMAEFTNTNFVSEETNPQDYNLPSLDSAAIRREDLVQVLTMAGMADTIPPQCQGAPTPPCRITFLETPIDDRYRPSESGVNPRTSTYSFYDQFLAQTTTRQYSLNDINYNEARMRLVPRAVGYSAGLIDYMFRGRLEVTPPSPQGVFAIASMRPLDPSTPTGFNDIKAMVRNITPSIQSSAGAIPQEMSNGNLVVVAKFVRDACMQRDAVSGAYVLPNPSTPVCASPDSEEILISDIVNVPGDLTIPRGSATQVTFHFPEDIPINAANLVLQFVYNGQLGDETNVVVVETIDVAEPTSVDVSNDFDRYWDENDVVQVAEDDPSDYFPSVSFVFAEDVDALPASANFSYSSAPIDLKPGRWAGVWVLFDKAAPPIYSIAICSTCSRGVGLTTQPRLVEPDASGILRVAPPLPIEKRGTYVTNGVVFFPNNPPDRCNGLTNAGCLTQEFPPYEPTGPSVSVTPRY